MLQKSTKVNDTQFAEKQSPALVTLLNPAKSIEVNPLRTKTTFMFIQLLNIDSSRTFSTLFSLSNGNI